MMWIMFIITLVSNIYAIHMQFKCRAFEEGFLLLARLAYNPQTEEDCIDLVQKLNDERIRIKKTNNR